MTMPQMRQAASLPIRPADYRVRLQKIIPNGTDSLLANSISGLIATPIINLSNLELV